MAGNTCYLRIERGVFLFVTQLALDLLNHRVGMSIAIIERETAAGYDLRETSKT